jgi:predicted ArsR family transcriptional regulator
MLAELLRLIREGGSFDTATLAKKLDTTPEMVMAMMDHLRRNGLIKTYDPGVSSCEYCSLAQMCDPEKKRQEAGHLWLYEEDSQKKVN